MNDTTTYTSDNLPISQADFESIKDDLINFYKQTSEFKDYDFEASRMSQQMNLLAYVALFNQQYANVAIQESNIRTAQIRNSVVMSAQDVGYIPSSVSSSRDTIQIKATLSGADTPLSVDIPAYTTFTGTVNLVQDYNFITWQDTSIAFDATNNEYTGNVDIVQGYRGIQNFTYDPNVEIVLFDNDIDTNYIKVSISDTAGGSTSGEYSNYTKTPMTLAASNAKVFYVNQTTDGFARIFFGNGVKNGDSYDYVGGIRPAAGSQVTVTYLKTDGIDSNGATDYKFSGSLPTIRITEIINNPTNDQYYNGSYGGANEESIEHIRSNASIFYETQNRCVTSYDYETLVKQNFYSYVQAIKVYGNSDNPGYAFMAIKPLNALQLTDLQKTEITSFLSQYNILTITPIIVEPSYLYINHYINVNYSPSAVPQGSVYLKNQIINSVDDYYSNNVELFQGSFHSSRCLRQVDDSNSAILGSNMSISLVIEVPDTYIKASPTKGINFMNPIYDVWNTSPITFKTANSDVESYINLFSLQGSMLAGPFTENQVTIDGVTRFPSGTYSRVYVITDQNIYNQEEYATGTYFEETITITDDQYYYSIGSVDTSNGLVTYDFNTIGIASNIYTNDLHLEATCSRSDIYSKDEGLVVFEPTLKPEYITINLEQIDNV